MYIRSADKVTARRLLDARESLLTEPRPEQNTHLADLSLVDVFDRFWPHEQDWTLAAAESSRWYVSGWFTHPVHGIGTTPDPGGLGR